MKLKKPFTFKYIIYAVPLLTGTLLFLGAYFFDANTLFRVPTATADTRFGIRGHPAPELNLSTWIDGNGNKIEPIRLSDYRGKVVYLYFWQDW